MFVHWKLKLPNFMVDSVLMSLYLIKTRVSFTSNFLDQNNPKFKFCARMSWSMSEILKPVKKRAVVYYQE